MDNEVKLTKEGTKERYPFRLLLPYLLFYAGQGLFFTYCNLYYDSCGFTKGQMGLIRSVATTASLIFQPVWGIISDRAGSRPKVLGGLFLACAATGLLFGTSSLFFPLLVINTLFYVFFMAIPAIMDSYTLEALDERKSHYTFGNFRLGGTIGYALAVYGIGKLIGTQYRQVFYVMSLFMVFSFLSMLGLKKAKGGPARVAKESSFLPLFKNKRLLIVLTIHVLYMLGGAMFTSYYSLYFKSFAGGQLVGLMMLVATMSELPWWPFTGSIIRKLGTKNTLVLSVALMGLKVVLNGLVTVPAPAIAINLISGFCFAVNSSCIISYIDDVVPASMRSRGQILYTMTGTVFAQIIGGLILGFLCDGIGMRITFVIVGCVLLAASLMTQLFIGDLQPDKEESKWR